MRLARGTKVKVAWIRRGGQPAMTLRWWNQIDGFIAEQRASGGHNFRVRGVGWKAWRNV